MGVMEWVACVCVCDEYGCIIYLNRMMRMMMVRMMNLN